MAFVPNIKSPLRQKIVEVPEIIQEAGGIKLFGKHIRSLIFTTDVSIIANCNADGLIAVYPFTPTIAISQMMIQASPMPVFCGVGGGLTSGQQAYDIALDAELHGAYGVVLNAPTPNELIKKISDRLDIPVVITVVSAKEDIKARLESGAQIFNVSGGAKTAEIVREIRKQSQEIAIIATGGPTDESIRETIEAGANVITYTPPTSAELFAEIMKKYRANL